MITYVFYIEKLNGSKFVETIKTCKRPKSTKVYKDLLNRLIQQEFISFGLSNFDNFIKNNPSFEVKQNNTKAIKHINKYFNNK